MNAKAKILWGIAAARARDLEDVVREDYAAQMPRYAEERAAKLMQGQRP